MLNPRYARVFGVFGALFGVYILPFNLPGVFPVAFATQVTIYAGLVGQRA